MTAGERATAALLDALRGIVGTSHVLTGEATAGACTDWTGRFGGPCLAVVRPGSTDEVAAAMRAIGAAGVPCIPQGGNTGLAGGGVPAPSGPPPVIVSTVRLSWLEPVDALAGQVTVGAGATLADVQRHARAAGWDYGVDLAARDSATIGGTVATNAGGIRVIAHGMTRLQVAGIEAVLPDGSVVSHLAGLAKDNTGYDLASLLCGSEGTLAVITAVRLRLVRPLGRTTVALVGVAGEEEALALLADARARGTVVAAESVDAVGMALACEVAGLPAPLASAHPITVLLEVADGGDGSGLPLDLPRWARADAVVATDAADAARLWAYRERQSEAFGSLGIIHKLDVSVPLPALPAFAAEARSLLSAEPAVTAFGMFGHLGDGNLHVEIAGPAPDDLAVDRAVLACVARFGGSISAEHGIGRAKAGELGLSRSPAEIAAMRAVKAALDPTGIMNPGVLLS